MRNFLLAMLLFSLSYTSLSAATNTSVSTINRNKNQVIKNIADPTGKLWAKSVINEYLSTIKTLSSMSYSDNKGDLLRYKNEVLNDAGTFLSDLKSKNIGFTISKSDKESVEQSILRTQQELISEIWVNLKNQIMNDTKLFSTVNLSFKTKNGRAGVSMDPYNILVTKDGKNIEMDLKLSASGSMESEYNNMVESGSIMFDVNLKIIENDLYLTLKNYSLSLPSDFADTTTLQEIEKLKGATYHMNLDNLEGDMTFSEIFVESQKNQEKNRVFLESILRVLQNTSIFTPIGTYNDSFILSWNPRFIDQIQNIKSPFYQNLDIGNNSMEIPYLLLYSKDGIVSMKQLLPDGVMNLSVQTITQNNPYKITLNWKERGMKNPFSIDIAGEKNVWKFSGSDNDYSGKFIITPDSLSGGLDNGNTRMVRVDIEKLSSGRWIYDISAQLEDYFFGGDMTFRVWGTFRQELGNFTVIKPTEYKEMGSQIKNIYGY